MAAFLSCCTSHQGQRPREDSHDEQNLSQGRSESGGFVVLNPRVDAPGRRKCTGVRRCSGGGPGGGWAWGFPSVVRCWGWGWRCVDRDGGWGGWGEMCGGAAWWGGGAGWWMGGVLPVCSAMLAMGMEVRGQGSGMGGFFGPPPPKDFWVAPFGNISQTWDQCSPTDPFLTL